MKGKRPVALAEMEPGRRRRLGRRGREGAAQRDARRPACAPRDTGGWGGDGWLPPLPCR